MSASPRTRTYFISDLHLGAGYIADSRAHEAAVAGFLHAIAPTARRLILLGDVLDFWFEYRTVVPRGHVRFFGALAALADSGVEIIWFTGNHDIWLFDYLRDEIGIEVVDPAEGFVLRNIDGTLFLLGHGDGIGRQPAGFRFLRALFRNRLCQWLFSGIHPRWAVAFANGWSSRSRKGCAVPDSLSAKARAGLEITVRQVLSTEPELRYAITGHHHVAVDEPVAGDCRLIVLGDWISHRTYAVFDGSDLTLAEYEPGTDPSEPEHSYSSSTAHTD